MKRTDLGQKIGAFANLAVLVGLILLIVELNQNSELLRAQIHQARSDSYESFMVDAADSEFFLPAYEKFVAAGRNAAALDALSPIERARISRYLQGRIGGYDNLYYQYRNGYLEEEFYESRVVESIKINLPAFLELGLINDSLVTPSFRTEIERIRSSE